VVVQVHFCVGNIITESAYVCRFFVQFTTTVYDADTDCQNNNSKCHISFINEGRHTQTPNNNKHSCQTSENAYATDDVHQIVCHYPFNSTPNRKINFPTNHTFRYDVVMTPFSFRERGCSFLLLVNKKAKHHNAIHQYLLMMILLAQSVLSVFLPLNLSSCLDPRFCLKFLHGVNRNLRSFLR